MTDRQFVTVLAAFLCQAVFGFLALGGLIAAAIAWDHKVALLMALAACASEVFSLSFQQHAIHGNLYMRAFALGAWIATFLFAIASFVSLT